VIQEDREVVRRVLHSEFPEPVTYDALMFATRIARIFAMG
jgi:hypothetical protein